MAQNTINERIKELVDKLYGGSVKALSDAAGINLYTMRDIVGGRLNKPTYDTIIKILQVNAAPSDCKDILGEINPSWLLFGKGDMYSFSNDDPSLADMTQIDSSNAVSATPVTNKDNAVSYKLVPLLNLDTVGGIHSPNVVSGDREYADQLIPFTDAQEGDVALTVSGESMSPTCPPGSRVLIRQIPQWREYFGYGNIFVLLLTDGRRILKEVQKYPEDSKNYVLCKSHNDRYPEEELPKSMIKSVWKVVKILNERGW